MPDVTCRGSNEGDILLGFTHVGTLFTSVSSSGDDADHVEREQCSHVHLDAITGDDEGNVYAFRCEFLRHTVCNLVIFYTKNTLSTWTEALSSLPPASSGPHVYLLHISSPLPAVDGWQNAFWHHWKCLQGTAQWSGCCLHLWGPHAHDQGATATPTTSFNMLIDWLVQTSNKDNSQIWHK